jgi:hypothetical protein
MMIEILIAVAGTLLLLLAGGRSQRPVPVRVRTNRER